MADREHRPVAHDHDEFLARAMKRQGLRAPTPRASTSTSSCAKLLAARAKAGLTQEQVAESMGTTKSAVSRLEAVGRISPSVSTLKKYARAVGCDVEIRSCRRAGAIDRRREERERGRADEVPRGVPRVGLAAGKRQLLRQR